jgi:hypothetical protein
MFKTAFAYESGDPGIPFKEEKNPRVENLAIHIPVLLTRIDN